MENGFKIRFYGDFTFGENYQQGYDAKYHASILRRYGYEFLLNDIKPVFNDAINFINLETPLTTKQNSSLEHKKFVVHWSDPLIVPDILKKYNIEYVSLGNNHTMDYEKEGLYETINALERKNIKYFGAGKNLSDAKKPFVKTFEFNNEKINLYVFCGYIYRKEYDLEYNFYAQENKEGVFDLNTDILREDIKKIKQEDKNSYIVIFPHYGSDFQKTLPSQINLSRQLIDMGADIVIGHGPHMMNNMEYYKDKVILYSIGNFLFPVDFKKKPVPYNLIAEIELYEKDNEIKINNNLYPIYIPNNSMLPLPRVINENEIDETINYLSENNPEVKDKIKIEKGEFICIKL